MSFRKTLIAASALTAVAFVAPMASAQMAAPFTGWYLGGAAGANFKTDNSGAVTNTTTGAATTTTGEFGIGPVVLGALGYDYGMFRSEIELGYRRNSLDTISGNTAVTGPFDGSLAQYSAMVNGYVDWDNSSAFTPYLGAGIGVDNVKGSARGNYSAVSSQLAANSSQFAYQGIAGVSYAIDRNWSMSAEYRYFRTTDVRYSATGGARGDVDLSNENHSALLGLRYNFTPTPAPRPAPAVAAPAPAPAAPAAPAPAPAAAPVPERYVVFFAWDRADITPVAAQVLDRAIADYRRTGMASVVIDGHADRSGTDQYNQRLSQRRADAVKAYLAQRGIAANNIQTNAYGETRPLVATPDGARNDENRRAEITLRR